MITDSHRHLVKLEEDQNFSQAKDRFLRDLAENYITNCIVIADNVEGSETADTQNLLEVFGSSENIKIIGSLNPFGDLGQQSIYYDSLLSEGKIVGLKMFNGFDELFPTDERCMVSYELATKHKVPVVFHTGAEINDKIKTRYNDPKYIVEIAKKFPGLKLVISHFYWPRIEYCLNITKDIENIYYDTTVLAEKDVVESIGSFEKVQSVLNECIKLKPEKVFFGSDFPACKTAPAIELINSLGLETSSKENIFSKNLNRLFGL